MSSQTEARLLEDMAQELSEYAAFLRDVAAPDGAWEHPTLTNEGWNGLHRLAGHMHSLASDIWGGDYRLK